MKSLGESLPSLMAFRYGKLVIESEEDGAEAMTVGFVLVQEPSGRTANIGNNLVWCRSL